MLIGHSFSQVCVGGRLSLMMCVYTYDILCIIDCGLLVQGKNGGVGRLVHWVEKASLEKICRLLVISKHERHYEVLLTLKNLADVRQNPAPYNLPIIPCSLSSEIVDREHFITADLLNLIVGGASSSRDLDVETLSRELVSRTPSGSSASTNGGSGSAQPAPSRGERGSRPESLTLPRKGLVLPPEY